MQEYRNPQYWRERARQFRELARGSVPGGDPVRLAALAERMELMAALMDSEEERVAH
jgi:hypothetical protein